jgi:hypothetical protein
VRQADRQARFGDDEYVLEYKLIAQTPTSKVSLTLIDQAQVSRYQRSGAIIDYD